MSAFLLFRNSDLVVGCTWNGDSTDDNFDDVPLAHESQESHFKRNPYAYLKPYFSELIETFEGNCTMDELKNIKDMFLDLTHNNRQKIQENSSGATAQRNTNSSAQYLSSNINCETKNKKN